MICDRCVHCKFDRGDKYTPAMTYCDYNDMDLAEQEEDCPDYERDKWRDDEW